MEVGYWVLVELVVRIHQIPTASHWNARLTAQQVAATDPEDQTSPSSHDSPVLHQKNCPLPAGTASNQSKMAVDEPVELARARTQGGTKAFPRDVETKMTAEPAEAHRRRYAESWPSAHWRTAFVV